MYADYVTNILVIILLLLSLSSLLFIITSLIIAYFGRIFQRKDFLNFFKTVIRDHTSYYSYFKNKLNSC